jgi:NusA-like KH domain protein
METTKVFDMQFIRYANLFFNVTKIRAKHCFEYNHTIIFVVPKHFVLKAIGYNNSNLEKLNRLIGKRIKIVADHNGINDMNNFVSIITKPVRFNSIEVIGDEAVINAGNQSKASLIGRDKVRLEEMQNILEQYFGIKKVRVK